MTAPASTTITDELRGRLRVVVDARGLSCRMVAAGSGVSASTVSRFLRGASLDGDSLDRLAAWVEKRERSEAPRG